MPPAKRPSAILSRRSSCWRSASAWSAALPWRPTRPRRQRWPALHPPVREDFPAKSNRGRAVGSERSKEALDGETLLHTFPGRKPSDEEHLPFSAEAAECEDTPRSVGNRGLPENCRREHRLRDRANYRISRVHPPVLIRSCPAWKSVPATSS